MNRASQIIAHWLVTVGAISGEDENLYAYAVYSFLFGLIPAVLSIVFGLLLSIPLESILMITPFIIIRKFSGGFHVKSASLCFILTSSLLAGALFFVRYAAGLTRHLPLSLSVVIATAVIFAASPIDSEERALTTLEISQYGRIARFISIAFLIVYFLLLWIGNCRLFIPVGVGVIVVAILQTPCIIFNAISKNVFKSSSSISK